MRRYEQMGTTMAVVYAPDSATPVRAESVTARRYTAWEPAEDAHEVLTKEGDTMQSLAAKFYGDPMLWWVIADHNPAVVCPLDLRPGVVLRFPRLEGLGAA